MEPSWIRDSNASEHTSANKMNIKETYNTPIEQNKNMNLIVSTSSTTA